jgi:hypothetical protein
LTTADERMRITSAGNVGIGTSSPSSKLTISSTTGTAEDLISLESAYSNPSGNKGILWTDGGNNLGRLAVQYTGPTASMTFGSLYNSGSNNTELMRLTGAGNLGIGETSPTVALVVKGTQATDGNITYSQQIKSTQAYNASPFAGLTFSNIYTSGGASANLSGIGGGKENATDGNYSSYLAFYTRVSGFDILERMRIDSSGNLLVGTTTAGGGKITSSDGAQINAIDNYNGNANITCGSSVDTTGGIYVKFLKSDTSNVGTITRSGSNSVGYNSVSDYRLKTVIGSVTNAGQRIDALEPIEYDWNTGGRARGFLAHKFSEIYPNSVSGEKDAVDKDGKPIYQTMQASTSEVMADLIAEIQSLRQRITTLENK